MIKISFRANVKGQSLIELAGSFALSAIVVAASWAACHFAMPVLFQDMSDGIGSYYHTE